jgi:hypothetical protein
MTNIVQLIITRPFVASQPLWRISLVVFAWVLVAPVLVFAHGGMGPDEIGPPIMTSSLLGFVGYWAVMLWPTRKKKDDAGLHSDGQGGFAQRTARRAPRRTSRVKRAPRLRKIEGGSQIDNDQNPRRRASDG